MASLTVSTFLIVCLYALVLVSAAPNKKDTQVKKASQVQPTQPSKFLECNRECPTEVTAICARDSDGKKYSFGNLCVMDRYNCAHDSKLVKESDGECPGIKSIRLS